MTTPATVPLNATGNCTLNGSGAGVAQVGPLSGREIWSPENVHVQANVGQVTNESSCNIYVGDSVGANNFRDGTFSGSSGDSTDKVGADIVKCGSYIWASWTGGDPGVQATLIVTGTKTI